MTVKNVLPNIVTTLNAIRDTASNAYQTAVPMATMANFTDVGTAVLSAPDQIQNEFMNAINKIALTLVDTVDFTNPLTGLVKGKLTYGMTVEHLHVQMIESIPFVPGTRTGESVPNQFEIFKPQNEAAYYQTMYERQYPITRFDYDTKRAFKSPESLQAYILGIAQALRSSEQFDDYRMQVALMARQIEELDNVANTKHKGKVKLLTLYNAYQTAKDASWTDITANVAVRDPEFLRFAVAEMKKWAKRLQFVRDDINFAGVKNTLKPGSRALMALGDFTEALGTYLYADTFNPQYLEVDDIIDIDAWYSIGADDTTPVAVSTPDDIVVKSMVSATGTALAVIFDKKMYQIYNQDRWTKQAENARGGYTNTFTTIRDLYAMSPYSNFVVFTLD